MIAEISAGIGSLKAAMDIAKGLNAAAGAVAINDAEISLQSVILEAQANLLAAQESQASNLKRIDQLEAEIVQLKGWEGEKERYQLKEFPTGAFAYAIKHGEERGEPAHCLCPNCYQQGHKAILQTMARHSGGLLVECQRCTARLTLSEFQTRTDDHGGASYF